MSVVRRFWLASVVTLTSFIIAAPTYAVPLDSALCDLGELLQKPETIADFATCTGFFVKVGEQPITCGLYEDLSADLKSAWAREASKLCAESENCKEVMAECAAKPLASTDIKAPTGGSSSPALPTSSPQPSPQSSPTPQVGAVKSPSPSTSSVRSGTPTSARSSPTPITIGDGTRSIPTINTGTTLERPPIVTKPTAAPSRSPSPVPTTQIPDCYVCIYDDSDKSFKAECDARAKRARSLGIKKIVVTANHVSLSDYREELCQCKNIDVLAAVHGSPGDESLPFTETTEILEVAPQCSNITFDNWRCSGFDSVTAAVAEAEKLSKMMAKNGYAGSVTVTGRQSVHSMVQSVEMMSATVDEAVDSALANFVSEDSKITLLERALIGSMVLKKKWQIKKRLAKNAPSTQQLCDMTNTPITFEVCAEGVRMALAPCKNAGDVSELHKSENATQTIVCAKNGKRANQSCSYITLNEVPNTTLISGESLREKLEGLGYGEDGCNAGAVCLCKWKEAEVCSS